MRVSADARFLVEHDEVAEAGDFHRLATLQRLFDDVEEGLDHFRRLALEEPAYVLANSLEVSTISDDTIHLGLRLNREDPGKINCFRLRVPVYSFSPAFSPT